MKIKRHILLPIALFIYTVAMALIAYPRYKASGNWTEYFTILGICLLMAIFLFIILKRRQKIRNRFSSKNDLNQ